MKKKKKCEFFDKINEQLLGALTDSSVVVTEAHLTTILETQAYFPGPSHAHTQTKVVGRRVTATIEIEISC